jgi:hypothetical protein
MRRTDPRRGRARAALLAISGLALIGAGAPKKDPPPPGIDETIANLADIKSNGQTQLEGVGLVCGLEDTGVDPPPSWYREQLVDEMRKADVPHPNEILKDPRFSMVIVKLSVPIGAAPSDRLDVRVEVPPGCGTTSLAGGYLMRTRLRQTLIAGGAPRNGTELASAQGPIMIGSDAHPDDAKVGRVLGGARVKNEVPFGITIKEGRRSYKTSALLQAAINLRFSQTGTVKQEGMAKAKSDEFLELKVPRVYHHNYYRYFRLIKLLPVADTPALREQRKAEWGRELLDPKTAGVAALRLEGMGVTAIDTLKTGLASPNAQVRFLAAEALAYLGDASGTEVLGDTATQMRDFRGVALAALAAVDQPAARTRLRRLMDVPDVEVRYGAFNALRELDETDPDLGRVRVLDAPPEPEEEGESMSLAIASAARRRRNQPEDPFTLYMVDSDGPPMVHVAKTRRPEIVIFGRSQKLLTPVVLGTGPILLNASDGDEKVQISKIVATSSGADDDKMAAPLEVGEVIRRTANLGAKYPDVVTILQAAARQKNLPGPLVVDAVPGTSPVYEAAALLGLDTTKKDPDVAKAKYEKRRGLFGLFGRRPAPKADPDKTVAEKPAPAGEATAKDDSAKKDPAVGRAKNEEPESPGFLGRIFGGRR